MFKIQLDFDPNPDASKMCWSEVCYEVYTPTKEVARLSRTTDGWKWVDPFETYDWEDTPPILDADSPDFIEFIVDPESLLKRTETKEIDVVTMDGSLEKRLQRIPSKNPTSKIRMNYNDKCPVAFGVRAYAKYPRSTKFADKQWQWVSTVLVLWKHLAMNVDTFGLDLFCRSDWRIPTDDPNILHFKKHDTLVLTKPEQPFYYPRFNDDLVSMMKRIDHEYVYNEYTACVSLAVTDDPDAADPETQLAHECRIASLDCPIEGLQYPADDTLDKRGFCEPMYGISMQSWYYYSKPVVTEEWLLARLRDVFNSEVPNGMIGYIEEVEKMKKGEWTPRSQKILTDIVRLVTMHATTRPYVPDKRFVDGKLINADLFSSALTCPGDCEDGAHAAYMIYMSILFGKWKDKNVKALQSAAAILGVPVCITGTSDNPMRPGSGGCPHSYGMIIPFHIFVNATYGKKYKKQCDERFCEQFGFEYPKFTLGISAIETTLFGTPLSEYHRNENKEVYNLTKEFIATEFDEKKCAWKNVGILHLMNRKVGCHMYAVKGFTDYHAHLFDTEWEIPLVPVESNEGQKANGNSRAFAFMIERSGKMMMGLKRSELYYEKDRLKFKLMAMSPMSTEIFELDMKVASWTQRPYVPLVPVVADPFKGHRELTMHIVDQYADEDIGYGPHTSIFVYDWSGKTKSGLPIIECIANFALENKLKFRARSYGFCTQIMFSDFMDVEGCFS